MNKKDVDDFCRMAKEYPDLWYNFSYGTFKISLKFNRNSRKYYIEWLGFNPFPRYEQFYDYVRCKGNFVINRPEKNVFEYFEIAKKCYFEHLIKALQVYKVSL